MITTVLVTEPNGETKSRPFSHIERFESVKQDVPWPVYDRRKEMVYFNAAKGTLSIVKRDKMQVLK